MTLRANGSYIGPRDSAVSTTAASGVWDLRTAQRYREAGTWPVPFAPDYLSGLQLWLDASDSSTLYDATTGGSLVAADGTVARWEDKSGNARHATQGTAGARPLRKASVQNSLDALRFDGSDDVLSVPSSTTTFKNLHSADSTVLCVCKATGTATAYAIVSTAAAGGVGPIGTSVLYEGRIAYFGIADPVVRVLSTNNTGPGYQTFDTLENGPVWASGTFIQFSAVIRAADATAANRVALRKNGGNALTPNTINGATNTNNSTNNLTIGAIGTSNGFFLNGDICEIIVYNSALSDTDREAVENYLIAKWGIS